MAIFSVLRQLMAIFLSLAIVFLKKPIYVTRFAKTRNNPANDILQ